MTIGSVFDTLAAVTEDGELVPYLAESITPNEDYTVWTFVAREGVTFHDGTPFDGAAMVDNITRQFNSFLTGKVFADVATNPDGTPQIVLTDPMTMTITMKRPWVVFPIYLAAQPGMIGSPTWMAAADADPDARAEAGRHRSVHLQGLQAGRVVHRDTQPRLLEPAVPVSRRVRDPGHPRRPDARASALEAGDVDLIHTTNGDTIAKFRDDPENFPMLEETDYGETGYTLLHVTQEGSPLTDARVRCAMAESTDAAAIIDQTQAGVPLLANGPFSPAQVGHLDDTGFPTEQNMEEAQALIADYKAENPGPLNINLSTTQDATNLIIAQAQQQFYTEAGFDDVQISQIEQAKYILTALQGDFQAFQWRNHGGYDLDGQYIWWTIGECASRGRARAQLRPHQGRRHRRGAQRQPGRDRPRGEAGARRDGQQAVRRAVLQPLALLDGVGPPPHAQRHGRRSVHAPRRLHPKPGHWRHVQPCARSGSTPTRSETHSKREVTA